MTVLFKNIDTEDGRFLSPLIAQGIYDAFFSHAAALGCLYQPHFTPFPHTALALILTAVSLFIPPWLDMQHELHH